MISIAMTTYNGERYIKKQLDSILNQTFHSFELVVCDDNSKDSTFSILEEYSAKDNRIHIFKNDKNLGFLRNFEKCITLTKNKYIALCDQDDIWTPDHLETLYKTIEKNECSLVGGNSKLIDEKDNFCGGNLINYSISKKTREDFKQAILYRNFFQGAATIFDREVIETALPFPEGVPFHDWWLALVASEYRGIMYIDKPILYYRQHSNNVTGFHKTEGFITRLRNYFSLDRERMSYWEKIISAFLEKSKNPKEVNKIVDFINKIENRNFSAVFLYLRNYSAIYGNESLSKKIMRKIKFILTFSF